MLAYEPAGSSRSPGSSLLAAPQSRTKTFDDAGFSRYTLSCWNTVPEDLRGAYSKTLLVSLAFMQLYLLF